MHTVLYGKRLLSIDCWMCMSVFPLGGMGWAGGRGLRGSRARGFLR